MKSKIIFLLLLLVMLTAACNEGNEILYESNAKLIWTGDYDVNGCGYYIEIDSLIYKPENEFIIPRAFKSSDTLSVTVQYFDLLYDKEYLCGDQKVKQKHQVIKLTSIDLNGNLPD